MKQQLIIDPPLLNSANPWCTSLEQLQELYNCPYTGAVTTRTSLLDGFRHDETIHQFTFYNPSTHNAVSANPTKPGPADETGSLNTLGYSPLPLKEYLGFIQTISTRIPDAPSVPPGLKPFIISVTGTVGEVVECYKLICTQQATVSLKLAMEVNLSCPNIPDKPPPAYDSTTLLSYLTALKIAIAHQVENGRMTDYWEAHVPIGIKTPPYTYHDQFKHMIDALLASTKETEPHGIDCPISFITATNTLGSSLLLTPASSAGSHSTNMFQHTLKSATGAGIGGLAGAPLHPLALGNVYTIKRLLSQHKELENIQIIGVGGVEDADGYQRMRAVGAAAVGVGTALGRKGVKIFEEIGKGLEKGNQ
ncbi:FMN-linked oxidoreductase [Melanomma pulvis-pyrius CBS 109.77]|uniref:Dihydroorotate dehydrogenase (fumarate) n=1 Tax=Melanomma pulvis-pyrius CBS 109.77 TaxID=1314802 RepID=A0A6A6XF53_9PLEO|nr:FMN-linked oxidoreductase [Melanomma pulvis-pyrius CBS 109.77]